MVSLCTDTAHSHNSEHNSYKYFAGINVEMMGIAQ